MSELLQTAKENLLFLAVTAGIALALYAAARLLEHGLHPHAVSRTRRLTSLAMCGALAAVLHIFDFPLPFLAPGFYKLDFSELPVLLCAFYLGPTAGVACEALKILLKLLLKGTSTAFVGDFANFVVGCMLVLPAAAVYLRHRSRKGAILGLALGTVVMTVFGTVFNALYLLPKFAQLYGMPMEAIVASGTAINPGIRSVWSLVLLAVAPLNLIKGTLVSVLTLLLYKRVQRPLFGVRR